MSLDFGKIFYFSLLHVGELGGTSTIDNNGQIKYRHGVGESASQYLTVLKFINKINKSTDLFKKMISIFEKIVKNNYKSEDIVSAGSFIESYPLNELVMEFLPKEIIETNNVINDMSTDELKKYIEKFKAKSNDENTNVLIAYLNYCMDEKEAEDYNKRLTHTTEEMKRMRADQIISIYERDAARAYAYERASKIRMWFKNHYVVSSLFKNKLKQKQNNIRCWKIIKII